MKKILLASALLSLSLNMIASETELQAMADKIDALQAQYVERLAEAEDLFSADNLFMINMNGDLTQEDLNQIKNLNEFIESLFVTYENALANHEDALEKIDTTQAELDDLISEVPAEDLEIAKETDMYLNLEDKLNNYIQLKAGYEVLADSAKKYVKKLFLEKISQQIDMLTKDYADQINLILPKMVGTYSDIREWGSDLELTPEDLKKVDDYLQRGGVSAPATVADLTNWLGELDVNLAALVKQV